MKTPLLLLLFGFSHCVSPDKQVVLNGEEEKKVSAFELAQKNGDSASCNASLALRGKPELFCAFVEKAELLTLEHFFRSQGFLLVKPEGNTFHFGALCSYTQQEISCLIKRIRGYAVDQNELQTALKITGINLCDSLERSSFIRTEILRSKDYGASELLFLSNLIKLEPANAYFESGFKAIIDLADKGSVALFLKKSGFVEFDKHSDEYTSYHPEKLGHLGESQLSAVLDKAEVLVP